MAELRPTSIERKLILRQIEVVREQNGLEDDSRAFMHFFLSSEFDLTASEIEDLITDGAKDRGIDAVLIDEKSDFPVIKLYQFKYHKTQREDLKGFPSGEIDKIITFLLDLFEEKEEISNSCNLLLWQKILQIWECFKKRKFHIEIYLVSNGNELSGEQHARFLSLLSKYNFVSVYQKSFSDIQNISLGRKKDKTVHFLPILGRQYFEKSDGNIRGVFATIDSESLIQVISLPTDNSMIDKNLFDENIRVYLGSGNSVNASIIKSALSDENSLFWYLNNGVTMVCESFSYQSGKINPVIEIQNLQIVNGAQTSHALFEAFQLNPEAVRNVLILVKIFETKINGLSNKVAISTNSQTRINNRDLMSNNIIQINYESLLSSYGFYYERKKNQHSDKPLSLRIDALRLGQVILAFRLRQPERAKTMSDKIFGDLFDEIFNQNFDARYLLNMWRLNTEIESIRGEVLKEIRFGVKRTKRSRSNDFITYGQYHVLYIVSVLIEKNNISFDSIIENVNLHNLIDESMTIIRDALNQKTELAFYNYFRDARSKELIYERAVLKQLPLPF